MLVNGRQRADVENEKMLEGATYAPKGATADPASWAYSKLPKWLRGLLALCYRTHKVDFVIKLMNDFNVHFVVDLSVGHGFGARACSELERPCISVTFNDMHTEFVTRALDEYLIKKMGTQGHRLFLSQLQPDVHRAFACLFKPLDRGVGSDDRGFESDDEFRANVLDIWIWHCCEVRLEIVALEKPFLFCPLVESASADSCVLVSLNNNNFRMST